MTEINFYVSKEEGLEHRFAIVYRLVDLALKRKLRIHIHTDNEATSVKLDDYLWVKDNASFIPHAVIEAPLKDSDLPKNDKINEDDEDNKHQINISHNYEPLTGCDYLINISNQRPAFFSRFLKVAEILDKNEEILTAGRKRYSFYRDRGYTLEYYQL